MKSMKPSPFKKALLLAALGLSLSLPAGAQSLEEGMKMVQYERYESAKRMLEPLAATNAKAAYYLGLSQLKSGMPDAAQATFAKYPDDAANIAGSAQVAYSKGNKAEGDRLAAAAADKAKRKDVDPLRYAADAYLAGGEAQKAIDLYNKVLEKGEDPTVRVALGDAYLKLPGGGGQSMSSYERITGADPKNSLAYSRIGAVWYAAKNYPLALENYKKAKEADPTNPLPYRDLANAYYYSGNYAQAKANIEEYLKYSDKTDEDDRQYLDLLYLSKDYKGAVEKAKERLQGGKTSPGLYGILGYSQMEIGDTAAALENARKYMMMQKPEKIFISDYMNLGRIYMMNGQTDSAVAYYNQAVLKDTAKDKSDTYRKIAEALKDGKDYPSSAKWYTRLITENPDTDPIDYFWAGAMNYYSKNYPEAGRIFESMETKYPAQPSATYWRGRVAAAVDESGKTGAGVPFYEKWLEGESEKKDADLMQAYQYLALHFYTTEKKAEMNKYLEKIETLEPGNSFAKQIRDASAKRK